MIDFYTFITGMLVHLWFEIMEFTQSLIISTFWQWKMAAKQKLSNFSKKRQYFWIICVELNLTFFGVSTKNFRHAWQILVVKWVGNLSESIKKGKLLTEIFFSDNVEWNSTNLWKMISANLKSNKNNTKWKIWWGWGLCLTDIIC